MLNTIEVYKMTHRATVVNYDSSQALRNALQEYSRKDVPVPEDCDWILPVPDPEAHPQSIDVELQRLLTLKSYLILDSEREAALDELTKDACEHFGVPVSLISLVDLGRQWAISAQGTDVLETSRKIAFCSHTILSKQNICIVPDTKKDQRFCNNILVTGPPSLRFYAAAPLISPEGYKLGTFCVEGPEPRAFSEEDQKKLQDYAAKAMKLMVERRRNIQKRMDAPLIDDTLRRHAGVSTNLGCLVYRNSDELVLAMRYFQESVQTLMYVKDEGANGHASKERQDEILELLQEFDRESLNEKEIGELLSRSRSLFPTEGSEMDKTMAIANARKHSLGGIPGLFIPYSNLKGNQRMSSLLFGEVFQISLEDYKDKRNTERPIEERQFIIPLEQCSKATLFNMGLIHYRWGSSDSAMQFFDLAASLSQQLSPLAFDPVILGSLNNMAQINLQYSRPDHAMELLTDALARGNAALATMYGEVRHNKDTLYDDEKHQADEVRRSRRLRRKLARTILNTAHVHFFKSEFDKSLASCRDTLRLLHTNMDDPEVAAVWYNMGLLEYHKGNRREALELMDKFLSRAEAILGPDHVQVSEGLTRKAQLLFENGKSEDALSCLERAVGIRKQKLGNKSVLTAEALSMIGKFRLARTNHREALPFLQEAVDIYRHIGGDDGLSLDAAQVMLDLGRSLRLCQKVKESLSVYEEVLAVATKYFGAQHSFVARVNVIIGQMHLEQKDLESAQNSFRVAAEIQKGENPNDNRSVDKIVKAMLQQASG